MRSTVRSHAASGIYYSGTGDQGTHFVGNVIFAATPIGGNAPTSAVENIVGSESEAASYVATPSRTLPIELYPLAGKLEGSPLDLSIFAGDTDFDRDFNGASKASFTFRGAYAGSGMNPGWPLAIGPKGKSLEDPDDGGSGDGGSPSGDGGCAISGTASAGSSLLMLVGVLLVVRRGHSRARPRAKTSST